MLWSDRGAGDGRRDDVAGDLTAGGEKTEPTVMAESGTVTMTSEKTLTTPISTATGGAPDHPAPVASADRGFRLVDRRGMLRLAGAAAIAAPAGGLLAACGGSSSSTNIDRPVRIGVITPQSGALKPFSDADLFVTDTMRSIFASIGGIPVGKRTHPVEIYVRDSQSNTSRAARATTSLIYEDKVDIVLVGSTADTVNPVSDQCEANGVPCISTMAPWQSWFYARGGKLKTPFTWTYHFFAGIDDIFAAYAAMWGQTPTNRTVGALWPDDIDGQGFSNDQYGFRKAIQNVNFRLVNPGASDDASSYRYQPGTGFSDIINRFKDEKVEIVTGIPQSADFAQFEKDAGAAGFAPKIYTVSKALMFQLDMKNLGELGDGMATEMWWSPRYPGRSFLTNATSEELANQYAAKSGFYWSQQIGTSHALFEVAAQALAVVDSIDDRRAIADAIGSVTARTIVGQLKFGSRQELPKNVATLPLVGAQWQLSPQDFKYDLKIVNNAGDTQVAREADLVALQHNS
jgi:branched-chain amino acid transport system substrate-binding protein